MDFHLGPWVLTTCPCCDGAGEWDEGPMPASSGATEPEYRQVICSECEGTGRAFVPAEPIDLDDISAALPLAEGGDK